MFEAFVPKITLPAGKESRRAGGGIGIKCGDEVMFVDGFEGGEPTNGLKDWLEKNGVSTVKTAVLTHIHYDHYHGLMEIEDDPRFHIDLVLMYDPLTLKHGCDSSENGQALQDDIDRAYKFIRYMQARGTKVKWIDKGSTVKCGDTTWKVYRNQPRKFTADDDGNAYAFVNDGSLVLCSPEVPLLFGGDGCIDLEDAIAYFNQLIIAMYVQHHGNCCPESDAKAAKEAGVILMWETNVERKGPGTTGFTMYGSRRVIQQGIPVWMQNQPIYITAANGKIVFRQGSKIVTANIPYQGFQTGWGKDAKGWFYTLSDGRRAKGWIKVGWSKPQSKDGRDWFFMDDEGYMVKGFHKCSWSGGISTFYFDENGVMQTGWKHIGGRWYYFDLKTGAMKTGWLYDNGSWFYLGTDGKMVTGWVTYKGRKCYLEPKSDKNHVQGTCYVNRTAVIDGKTYRFDKDGYAEEVSGGGVSKVNPGAKVVDISEFQPEDIDWSKIKAGGYAVIIRIGLRGSIPNTDRYRKISYDRHFKKYLNGVIQAGIPYSLYYFPTPLSDAEADEEANWLIANVDGIKLSMPLWMDSERVPGGVANDISTAERTRYLKRITDRLVAAGIPCGIYASTSWLQHQISMSQLQQQVQDNTWCAQYNTKCTYDGIYAMWQYSSKAKVEGISGNVDISEVKRNFNMSCRGTEEKTDSLSKDNVRVFPTTDPVKISNSGSDEHGNYRGGAAGDNTGREWYIRDWYNRPWNCVLRHPDPEVRACLADLATKAANNNKIGYDQYQRETYWKELQKVGYDPSKITTACEADCSAGVIANVKAAGHILGKPELQNVSCTYTGNMRSGLTAAGFVCLTDSKYLTSSAFLVAGDVLLNDKHHTATAVTNGVNADGSTPAVTMPLLKKGSSGDAVKKLQEMLIAKGYSCGKYGADSDFGPATESAVKAYQRDHGLTVDGEVGEKTWGSLFA